MKTVLALALAAAVVATAAATEYPDYCGPRPWAGQQAPEILSIPQGHTLVATHMVIRHGDRTVSKYSVPCWANDSAKWNCSLKFVERPAQSEDELNPDRVYEKNYLPGRNVLKGNCAIGQLTEYGHEQHISNGQALRRHLVDNSNLLPSDPQQAWKSMFIRSDDEPRTVQSAQSLMEGLFPPSKSPGGTVPVFQVYTMDQLYDDMTPNPAIDPALVNYTAAWKKSAGYVNHTARYTKPLLQELQRILGMVGAAAHDPVGAEDCLNAHACHDFAWPDGITGELYDRVMTEAVWQWQAKYNYPSRQEYAKAGMGYLLREIFDLQQDTVNGKDTVKYALYSGHDSTLMPLLAALDIWNQLGNKWTPYASRIVMDLYKTPSGGHGVRVSFNGVVAHVPGCATEVCTFAEWTAVINSISKPDKTAGSARKAPKPVRTQIHK